MYVTYSLLFLPLPSHHPFILTPCRSLHCPLQLVWECRTDASKFFFPPTDFDPSSAPAMLSCATLEKSGPPSLPALHPHPSTGKEPCNDRVASQESLQRHGMKSPLGQKVEKKGGLGPAGLTTTPNAMDRNSGSSEAVGTVANDGHGRQDGTGGGDKGAANGRNLMRPFAINFDEEVGISWTKGFRFGEGLSPSKYEFCRVWAPLRESPLYETPISIYISLVATSVSQTISKC